MGLLEVMLIACALPAVASAGDPAIPPGAVDHALARMYNFDFPEAQRILDRYIAANPADPVAYAVRAAALLFSELDRLMILEIEFFTDDERIRTKTKLAPDPDVRRRLHQAAREAQKRARAVLAVRPNDRSALFALSMATGVLTDYAGLVEKRKLASLALAKESHGYALELLRHHPTFYDAHLTMGLSEYLTGSLPFFVRWFVRFDQVEGSKARAVKHLELAARSGRYLGPFAKILLAILHLREKRPWETEKLLAELARDYPENPLIRKELAKVSKMNSDGGAARTAQ